MRAKQQLVQALVHLVLAVRDGKTGRGKGGHRAAGGILQQGFAYTLDHGIVEIAIQTIRHHYKWQTVAVGQASRIRRGKDGSASPGVDVAVTRIIYYRQSLVEVIDDGRVRGCIR